MWNPTGYNPKPSRLDRDVAKFERRKARDRQRAAAEKAAADAWEAVRRACYARDHGMSRISGKPLDLHNANPWKVADFHHIVFRSCGGTDETANVLTVARDEHDMIHGRHARFLLDVAGDADGIVSIVQRSVETGRIVREWESAA